MDMGRIREFRGLTKDYDNRRFVYGCYAIMNATLDHFIIPVGMSTGSLGFYKVSSDTVGQFTDKYDSIGNKIYEGDILQWTSSNPFSLGEIRSGLVHYIEAHFWCQGSTSGSYLGVLLVNEKCRVIGNMHENTELL